MNWIRWETFLGITVWTAPLLGLIFLAVRVKKTRFILLLRVIYFPYLALMAFGLYWFWGGDGVMNLWLVPAVLVVITFLLFRFLKPKWASANHRFDSYLFFVGLAGYLTVCAVLLIYALIGKPLVIT